MTAENKMTKGRKFLTVLLGGALTALMMRVGGTDGFGILWGAAAVGTMLTLLIFSFYGNRAKMKYELIPFGTAAAALTARSLQTMLNLAGGLMLSGARFPGEDNLRLSVISQFRGIPALLIAGFAAFALFGAFTGTLFSEKEYKPAEYIGLTAAFFIPEIIAKLTFVHPLVRFFVPKASDNFESGLKACGYELTARQAYIRNFGLADRLKDVPFSDTYFSIAQHFAFAFGAIIVILVLLIVFRDKLAALISFAANIFSAAAVTAADYFIVNRYPTSSLAYIRLPGIFRHSDTGLWQLCAGAIFGCGIMFIIAVLPEKYTKAEDFRSEPYIENKELRFAVSLIFTLVAFAVIPFKALSFRLGATLEEHKIVGVMPFASILTLILSAAAGVVLLLIFSKNILHRELPVPFGVKPGEFAHKALTALLCFYSAIYLFIDEAPLSRMIYRTVKGVGFIKVIKDDVFLSALGAIAALIFFAAAYFPLKKKLRK